MIISLQIMSNAFTKMDTFWSDSRQNLLSTHVLVPEIKIFYPPLVQMLMPMLWPTKPLASSLKYILFKYVLFAFSGNCDPKSGKCFKCLKNTDGDKCENCRIGYYGDAVNAKNCTNCKCDNCGSAKVKCDQKNGQCSCKKNVMGKRCTQCKVRILSTLLFI